MDKKTILISGATGNVGGGAAMALARRGARVVLLGRRVDHLENRARSIRSALSGEGRTPGETDVDVLAIDFSDLTSVRHAAAEAKVRYTAIHGLILSAVALVQGGPTILPSGHEIMFATNVLGPFLFTQLMLEKLKSSNGLVLHVIAQFHKDIDWDDLESVDHHNTNTAYERTKTMHRVVAGEMARRYGGKPSSVAFNPTFIIDRTDPELAKRWPKGFMGVFWSALTILLAKPPLVAGEPIAELMLSDRDPGTVNGALFELYKRVSKPDKAMSDPELGRRLWDELTALSG